MGTIVCAGISAPSKTIVPVKVPPEIAAAVDGPPLAAAGPDESGGLGFAALGCVVLPPPHPRQTATTTTKEKQQTRIVEPSLMAITPALGIEFEEDGGYGSSYTDLNHTRQWHRNCSRYNVPPRFTMDTLRRLTKTEL
jgi:hypothetical protein